MSEHQELDQSLFEKLFFKHYEGLCKKAAHIIGDTDIAKDIVQDVFMRIWRRRTTLNITDSYDAYLYKSCINQSLNYLKSNARKTRRDTYFQEARQKQAEKSRESEERIYRQELDQKIDEVINRMPPVCREVFLLSRYEEMSYREIAQHLNISVNTVEKHIGKALRLLRAAIK